MLKVKSIIKQPRMNMADDALLKLKKPPRRRDNLKYLVREKAKEENKNDKKRLLTTKTLHLGSA